MQYASDALAFGGLRRAPIMKMMDMLMANLYMTYGYVLTVEDTMMWILMIMNTALCVGRR